MYKIMLYFHTLVFSSYVYFLFSLSGISDSAIPCTAAHQASLSFTTS